jgi:hypothetical protein
MSMEDLTSRVVVVAEGGKRCSGMD